MEHLSNIGARLLAAWFPSSPPPLAMRLARFSAAVAFVCALATPGCGGGGGPTGPAPVASVSVELTKSSLLVGETTSATATMKDGGGNVLSGRGVSWSSSNASVATVTSTGAVLAVTAGTASISAPSEGRNRPPPDTLTLTPAGPGTGSLAAKPIT